MSKKHTRKQSTCPPPAPPYWAVIVLPNARLDGTDTVYRIDEYDRLHRIHP